MSIDELRSRIDALDEELLALVSRRAELAIEIARAKRKQKLPARDNGREQSMLARARTLAKSPLTAETAELAMRLLIDSTRGIAQLRSAKRSPTRRIAIIGLGLVGGSLARALKISNPEHVIRGVDLPDCQKEPLASGLFASVTDAGSLSKAVWDAELVFLCAPPAANAALLGPVRDAIEEDAIVTDVGGLKVDLCNAARKWFSPTRGPWFVGGHPMAGAAKNGFASSSELLFVGRPWILTPTRKHAVEPLKRLQRVIESTGATLALLNAEEHDRIVVAISHIPQLLALALSLSVAGRSRGLAGPALLEMTRLADSPGALWTELLRGQGRQVMQELQRLRSYLTEFEMILAYGEPLQPMFDRAAKRRKEIVSDA